MRKFTETRNSHTLSSLFSMGVLHLCAGIIAKSLVISASVHSADVYGAHNRTKRRLGESPVCVHLHTDILPTLSDLRATVHRGKQKAKPFIA